MEQMPAAKAATAARSATAAKEATAARSATAAKEATAARSATETKEATAAAAAAASAGAVRVAGVTAESVVDGPGLRFVIFAQGCPHRCPGCQNPETWNPAGGTEIAVAELLEKIQANPLLKGITLSGGEPFAQAAAFARLAGAVRERGLDVVTYTGYTWERLMELARTRPEIGQLIEASDYIVDGPYIEAQRDLALPFRGSRNQRVIDVRASLGKN